MTPFPMPKAELKAAVSLSLVFFLRMLPLFMMLPVLAFAEESYIGATPLLLGFALGIYGLTQACLQIPFGMLSDRWGRKPIITMGLIIFILGSLLAATSDSIYGLIFGRALQGAGAVAAAIMALAADLTSEEHRTKAMALIGMTIGLAFSIAFVIGPLLFSHIGINGLFYLACCLAILAITTLWLAVPTPEQQRTQSSISIQNFKFVLVNPELIKLNISIFTTHLIMMANFVVIPIELRDMAQVSSDLHWKIYLTVIFASLFIMVPFIIFSERLKKEKLFFGFSILLIIISQAGFSYLEMNLISIIFLMILFFGAFNFLEAFLPSKVSKVSNKDTKGTALGVYSSSQFIGIFIGGLMGGFLHEQYGIASVHLFCMFIILLTSSVMFVSKDKKPL
jgi:predicted MFS family arabinose efflux permease